MILHSVVYNIIILLTFILFNQNCLDSLDVYCLIISLLLFFFPNCFFLFFCFSFAVAFSAVNWMIWAPTLIISAGLLRDFSVVAELLLNNICPWGKKIAQLLNKWTTHKLTLKDLWKWRHLNCCLRLLTQAQRLSSVLKPVIHTFLQQAVNTTVYFYRSGKQ